VYNVGSGTCVTFKATVGGPPDDGLQTGPKHAQAWQRNKVKKYCMVLAYYTNIKQS
jgi:hypothetical protein